ncbi:Fic family protein [Candidatus Collierbacteria bacterium]|nr:Fic family protein [Candidatus Collierbacteria bacterium]
MTNTTIQKPFFHPFLSAFALAPETVPFSDKEIAEFDRELSEYEQIFLNPDVEKSLISKNELLASFAISKAENSQLTLTEARDVYDLMISDPDYDFINEKLKTRKKLTQKDHDKLEFFNIAKTFRAVNQKSLTIADLTPHFLRSIHQQLTQGLDVFADSLPDFTPYKSGEWRNNDLIRVGNYVPAPHVQIETGVTELLGWLKKHFTVTGVAIFHTALYALHPFNNGNKRVCRVLEHLLLRSLGLNTKNLYSTSYYYHKQKPRYYKYLLYSLERKNLDHFVSFALEALVLSIVSVVKTSLEVKRSEFLDRQNLEGLMKTALQPLVKHQEVQFKNLFRHARKKMARQTLVTYLQKATEQDMLAKRESGRTTFYGLNIDFPEVNTLKKWRDVIAKKLTFIPDEIRL